MIAVMSEGNESCWKEVGCGCVRKWVEYKEVDIVESESSKECEEVIRVENKEVKAVE